MEIMGYSERGVINALLYEIAYSGKSLHLSKELLNLADCPSLVDFGQGLTEVRVFIEQSLSDYGDADAILLLDAGDKKGVAFIEAKVKSYQKRKWKLADEFDDFKEGCGTMRNLSSSNLFTQLYHKHQFINGLSDIGIDGLKKGIDFPECSTKKTRRIGKNKVVLSAAEAIEPYRENVWYIALIPDTSIAVRDFYSDFRKNDKEAAILSQHEKSRWGGLAWEEIAQFCEKFGLKNTKQVLDFNKGQIY
ncbi:MAG: hypothetical protein WCJ37_06620 [Syntrophus sp. (in: bacteria)]